MSTQIYTGVWINWSQGPISGATLTLSARSGGLLTAFLALFVTIVGTQFWRFSCYVLHQLRSNPFPRDRIFHQRQVILRNSATPATGAWEFLIHGFRGFKDDHRSLLRALPWVTISTVYLAGFGVAAVFSSNISKSVSNERLVKSDVCGSWPASAGDADRRAKTSNDTFTAASYARACYGGRPDNPQCSRMPVSEISYERNPNASCPFASGLCVYGDTAALELTSKLIDSHIDLGINTPPEHRVQYQLRKTCAPINHTDYLVQHNATVDDVNALPGDRLFKYQFGPTLSIAGRDTNLTTYIVNDHSIYGNGGYILTSYLYLLESEVNEWYPIQALNRTDADVSIFFLEANTIRFEGVCNDPLFSAHEEGDVENNDVFFSDDLASVMACAEQMRVCNPQNNLCTPYLGSQQTLIYLAANIQELYPNDIQIWTALRVMEGSIELSFPQQVSIRKANALRVIETTWDLSQPPIPDTQWMIEVSSWFDTVLARLQLAVMEFAIGPSNEAYAAYYERPLSNSTLSTFCSNQIVRDSSDTTSFSILGLVILLVLGGIAILLNQLSEIVIGVIQKKTGTGDEKRKCWNADDDLNLQAAALNARKSMSSHRSYGESDLTKHEELGRMSSSHSLVPSQAQSINVGAQMMVPEEEYKQVYSNSYGQPFSYSALPHSDYKIQTEETRRW